MLARRDLGLAYVLLVLGGALGVHKFYLNQVGWGVAYFLTGGFFFIGVIVDLFTLPSQVARCNWELAHGIPYPGALPVSYEPSSPRRAELLEAERRLQDFDRRLNNLEAVIDAPHK